MSLDGKHILIISHCPQFVESASRILKKEEARPLVVPDYLDMIKVINQQQFAMIFLDDTILKKSAAKVLASLKSSRNKKCPLLLISEVPDLYPIDKLDRIGVVAVISKSVEQSLVLVCERVLQRLQDRNYYDPEIIKGYVVSIREVLGFYLKGKLEIDKPQADTPLPPGMELSSMIGFVGNGLSGLVTFSFDLPIIQAIVEEVFGFPEKPSEIEPDILRDFAGELGNQVLGTCRTKFANLGVEIEMGTPHVVMAIENKNCQLTHQGKTFLIPIRYGDGTCYSLISMERRVVESHNQSIAS